MTKLRQKTTSMFVVGLAVLAGACGNEADTPTDEDYEDIAQSVAPLIRKDLAADGGVMLSAQLAVGAQPIWLAINASGEASGNAGSLKWSLAASCTDQNNVASNVCSESASSARVTSNVDGMLMLPNFSAELTADLDWSISGLQTDTLSAQGQTSVHAATSSSGVFRPVMRSFELDFDARYDLKIPRANPELASGSLTAKIDAHRRVVGTNQDREGHFVVDAAVTLDGSGNAIIKLDGNASFKLDLSSGALVHVDASVGG